MEKRKQKTNKKKELKNQEMKSRNEVGFHERLRCYK